MSATPKPSVSASPLRVRVQHASEPLLQALRRAPRLTAPVVVLVILIIGAIFRGPVGAICFGFIALVVAWLFYLAWPVLRPVERLMRVAVLFLAVALTVVCAAG